MGWVSGQRYSQDLRDRVLIAVDSGMAVRWAAATFRVSPAYIYKALMRRRLTRDSGSNPNRGHAPRKLTAAQEMALAEHMRSHRGITLAMVQAWLEAEHGVSLSTGAVWNAVRRLGLSFKKSVAGSRAGPAGRGSPTPGVESRSALH
jgi:transposase